MSYISKIEAMMSKKPAKDIPKMEIFFDAEAWKALSRDQKLEFLTLNKRPLKKLIDLAAKKELLKEPKPYKQAIDGLSVPMMNKLQKIVITNLEKFKTPSGKNLTKEVKQLTASSKGKFELTVIGDLPLEGGKYENLPKDVTLNYNMVLKYNELIAEINPEDKISLDVELENGDTEFLEIKVGEPKTKFDMSNIITNGRLLVLPDTLTIENGKVTEITFSIH